MVELARRSDNGSESTALQAKAFQGASKLVSREYLLHSEVHVSQVIFTCFM